MTDASKAIVWDAVYTPFGQVHSITGTATNNQRFPGQYFDQETGYHYNYFRDYDPTTGREGSDKKGQALEI
jgi:RHS repeat-associated protein